MPSEEKFLCKNWLDLVRRTRSIADSQVAKSACSADDEAMVELPPGYESIFQTRHRKECFESRLVLASAGVSAEAHQDDGWWMLVVRSDDAATARTELDAYQRENSDSLPRRRIAIPIYGGAATGAGVYAAVILLVALFSETSAYGVPWRSVGRMQAGLVMDGQWWRVVTALTLHLDAGHILSNLVFGLVFGVLAGRVLGGGVAWLVIVIAGALGNFANAIVQPSDHSSIGASTAVFAALGLLVAHALRPRSHVQDKLFKRWSPLIAGALLLAFIGVGGERTDVTAHVTGFLGGMLVGWIGCRLPGRWLASRKVQISAGVAAIGLVTAAWIVGLIVWQST